MPRGYMHLIPDYGLIRCEGPDALRFLQGQISADVRLIAGQKGSMACDISLKGRVMAAFYLYAIEGGYELIVPRDQVDYLLADLKKYAVFSKVTLSDRSSEMHIVPELLPEPLTNRTPYQVLAESTGVRFVLTDRASFFISAEPAKAGSAQGWFPYLIEHNIPTLSAATRDLFLPHYIGLVDLGAVSFDKGCYKGQEVVARMHYRANIKKHISHTVLDVEQALNPGDTLTQGEVVNAFSQSGQTHVLFITPHTASL